MTELFITSFHFLDDAILLQKKFANGFAIRKGRGMVEKLFEIERGLCPLSKYINLNEHIYGQVVN